MKIVNNTDQRVVVRWKNYDPSVKANVTLCQLFPKGQQNSEVVVENPLDDIVYIQAIKGENDE